VSQLPPGCFTVRPFRGNRFPPDGDRPGRASFWRLVWAVARCDLRILSRRPGYVAAAIVPALIFLFIELLESAAVTSQPVALVMLDHGRPAAVVEHLFQDSGVLRVTDADREEARSLYTSVHVAAVITVPANFSARFAAHERAPIDVKLNNLNADSADDIRRSVADVITEFYATQGSSSPIGVTAHETDLRDRDVQIFEYEVVPTLVLILLITALVNTAVTSARELETRRFKETLLSPAPAAAIATGKVLAGLLLGCLAGVLELVMARALGWIFPEGWTSWAVALAVVGWVSLLAAGLGLIIGISFRRAQGAHTFAVSFSLYLFFLAGGIGVYAFEPGWLQRIGFLVPITYANHALQMAVFYHSSDQLQRDMTVLAVSSFAALAACTAVMRRARSH
jgi:ABC-2 type transport system permease protein